MRNFGLVKGEKVSLFIMSLLLSGFTTIAFHFPFFNTVLENVSSNFNGYWLTFSAMVIMLALNFFFYALLLFLGRFAGKCIIAFTLIADAVTLYFINTYNVLIDRDMMGNFYNTQYSEASSFFSWILLLYILFLGVLPSVFLFVKKVNYGTVKGFFKNIGLALLVIVLFLLTNFKNVTWIDSQAPVLGSKLMPWSYTINTFRYYNHWKKINQKEILLPDVQAKSNTKDVVVLIIGESARSMNFSFYGYQRETTPLMRADSVVALKAKASNTNTIDAVKAILSHQSAKGELYEILPNYLNRNGVDVYWRRSNWGTPPLHFEHEYDKGKLKEIYPQADAQYDGILFHNLHDHIEQSTADKVFIGIHTYTSHGPEYYKNSPDSLKLFFPECRSVEMSQAKYEELINAYDNSIVYTDFLVHGVIEMLKKYPDRRCCVLFVSDHGESLGEGGLYMHGVPLMMAPDYQTDIPFLVWTSDNAPAVKETEDQVSHYHVFHSILKFYGMETPFYDESKNIFK